ncbi:MAG TPA: hydrolase [Gemmatimonadaceae bacterium]|nr:hydrolase [Gemmatimonadaceae bacterium]
MSDLKLDHKSTALVLIDLQKGITGRDTAPYPSSAVVANGVRLAERFRAKGSTVVLVRVAFAADGTDRLQTPTDTGFPAMQMPPDWAEIVPELGPKPGDLVVTKRQWGAFYGTDLELHLRRRDIKTIVIGGISTNFGVESTARDAWERAYAMVFAEDAMAAMSADAHTFAITNIFPRLGRVRSTADVLKAL